MGRIMTIANFNFADTTLSDRSKRRDFWKLRLNWLKRVEQFLHFRRTRRRLEGLPDRIVKDIGISRSEIERIARSTDSSKE